MQNCGTAVDTFLFLPVSVNVCHDLLKLSSNRLNFFGYHDLFFKYSFFFAIFFTALFSLGLKPSLVQYLSVIVLFYKVTLEQQLSLQKSFLSMCVFV